MQKGFRETPVERFLTVTEDILHLGTDPSSLVSTYNSALLSAFQRFRNVYRRLVSTFPELHLRYAYICKADAPPEPGVNRKVEQLKKLVARYFPDARCEFAFLGAQDLLNLARTTPREPHTLQLAENPIASGGLVGFLCLVRLRDFYRFITDDGGVLKRRVFEANVRDFQGSTEVNREIMDSLRAASGEDFWWLNNGVSIIAARASLGGKELTLEDPEIVNGLQTSTQIHTYFRKSKPDNEQRHILVKILVPDDASPDFSQGGGFGCGMKD